ncbi:unnamed protein product [Callosobruchus maculatus]|uniref:Uracil-DNA glycosylase-like domain-containing protein n=1 Tax=Callosobruchus maculatus TaxID=64391 RepID=A0A653BXK1_CALMS|nr:unnamed protein product [Callosobruchus maculatus]
MADTNGPSNTGMMQNRPDLTDNQANQSLSNIICNTEEHSHVENQQMLPNLGSSEDTGSQENNAPASKKRQLNMDELFPVKKTATGCISILREKDDKPTNFGLSCNQSCVYCKLEESMNPKWKESLKTEFEKEYFKNIKTYLHNNRDHLPPIEKIFTFTQFFPLEETKVSDIEGFEFPEHGDLTHWANSGVLLLNTVLTVYKKPKSHYGIGWEKLTTRIIELVSEKCNNVVFMLWGKEAQSKQTLIKNPNEHLILCAYHPSYRGGTYFLGCKHFSQANKYLVAHEKEGIEW